MQVRYCSHELTECSHDHIVPPQGSSTAVLELNDLQIGDYVFTLTVTDGNNQQSTAEVSVAVVEGIHCPGGVLYISLLSHYYQQRPINHH